MPPQSTTMARRLMESALFLSDLLTGHERQASHEFKAAMKEPGIHGRFEFMERGVDTRRDATGYGYAPRITSALRRHRPHAILSAKRVSLARGALRVVAPLAVHNEPVLVRAGRQRHGGFPDAVILSLEEDGVFFPVGEVAEQQHFLRLGVDHLERLFLD